MRNHSLASSNHSSVRKSGVNCEAYDFRFLIMRICGVLSPNPKPPNSEAFGASFDIGDVVTNRFRRFHPDMQYQ